MFGHLGAVETRRVSNFRIKQQMKRICRVFHIVGHVEQLLGAALDQSVQCVLNQFQVVHISAERHLVPPSSGQNTDSNSQ